MDEYLSEKEQIELIRRWFAENGWYLVGGAVIAALGYFGLGQYQRYKTEQSVQASALYAQLVGMLDDDREGYEDVFDQLTNDYGSTPYADQARLAIAREVLVRDPARATEELRVVMNQDRDEELSMVARVRLARVLHYREDYTGALAVLDVEEPGEFAARINEIRGDVYAAQGQLDAARAAYTSALTAVGADAIDRTLVQMKLGDLPQPDLADNGA